MTAAQRRRGRSEHAEGDELRSHHDEAARRNGIGSRRRARRRRDQRIHGPRARRERTTRARRSARSRERERERDAAAAIDLEVAAIDRVGRGAELGRARGGHDDDPVRALVKLRPRRLSFRAKGWARGLKHTSANGKARLTRSRSGRANQRNAAGPAESETSARCKRNACEAPSSPADFAGMGEAMTRAARR